MREALWAPYCNVKMLHRENGAEPAEPAKATQLTRQSQGPSPGASETHVTSPSTQGQPNACTSPSAESPGCGWSLELSGSLSPETVITSDRREKEGERPKSWTVRSKLRGYSISVSKAHSSWGSDGKALKEGPGPGMGRERRVALCRPSHRKPEAFQYQRSLGSGSCLELFGKRLPFALQATNEAIPRKTIK